MRISEVDDNRVKIILSDTEVLCCFTSYDKLLKMDNTTKIIIKALLREITENRFKNKWKDISVNIRAKLNQGCIIFVTQNKDENNEKICVLEFNNSENLIKTAIFLNNQNEFIITQNSLFLIQDNYRIIFEYQEIKNNIFVLNEFCDKIYQDKINQQYTYEYGKLLIKDNAIMKISNVFKGS